jgi:DNA-binding transcriptional LysR family regulator
MARLDGRRLEYFVAVADHGGFTAASRAVFVSQPALSLAVKELEHELGTALFHRIGRGVALTPAGHALLGPARQTLRDLETGRAAVAAVVGLEAGSLTLGCLPTLVADPLAALVGRFRRSHPGIRIDVVATEDSADLLDLLRTGRCELGLATTDDQPADLEGEVAADHRLAAILPPGTPPPPPGRALGGLEDLPIVTTPEGTSSRRLLEERFAGVGRAPKVAVVTAQRDAVLPLVLAGAGGALVSEWMAGVAARLDATVGWPDPPIIRQVSLLHRSGSLAPAAERFCELARH